MTENNILNKIVRTRRSVKPEQFAGKPVADTVILEMLENARWAPTHARTEPWRFTIFTGDGLMQFAQFQSALYQQDTPADQFNPLKFEKLRSTPLKASHLILIGMKRQEAEKLPLIEEVAAVACAVENMLLTATSLGVGAYWSTGGMTYHPAMRTYLGLGEKDLCLGMLYVGHYDGALPEGKRTEMTDKVKWVR